MIQEISPSVRSSLATSQGVATSHTVTLPSSIEPGDLILALVSADNGQQITWDSEEDIGVWTEIWYDGGVSNVHTAVYAFIAKGGEASSTLTATIPLSDGLTWGIYVIKDWYGNIWEGVAISAIPLLDDTFQTDPPLLTPGWLGPTLWVAALIGDNTQAITTWPSDYTDNEIFHDGNATAAYCHVAARTRNSNDSDQDPTAFSTENTRVASAVTIAIRPPYKEPEEPVIAFRKPWTKKPPMGTKIDYTNPLSANLKVFGVAHGGRFYDHVSGLATSQTNGDVNTGTTSGDAFFGDGIRLPGSGTTDLVQSVTLPKGVIGGQKISAMGGMLYETNGANRSSDITLRLRSTAGTRYFSMGIRPHSGDSYRHWMAIYRCYAGQVDNNIIDSQYAYDYDTRTIAVVSFDLVNNSHDLLHPNGLTSTDTSAATPDNTEFIVLDVLHQDNDLGLAKQAFFFAVWENRVLTPAEKVSLQRNPWQIFKPQTIMVPAGDAAKRRLVVF